MKTFMRATAYHMVRSLATGIYAHDGQRVMELIRNALRAKMPDPKKWQPQGIRVELSIVPNHPLANSGPAFMCVDFGRSLTDPDLDRYFNSLGTPLAKLIEDAKGSIGDSQMGIGRFAALALNKLCLAEDPMVAVKNGYYLLARTQKSGPVRFIPFIPEKVETEGIDTDRFIAPDATEMGPLKGIQGSFTAIVVPTPVFETNAEIYEAIKWLLPRKRDKMFDLIIGGKAMQPPPLESEVSITSPDGKFQAFLGVPKGKQDGGVWLCDAETGLRVASCQKMGSAVIPDPLWYPDLAGDIFAPGLLAHQNTERSTLTREFVRRKKGGFQECRMFMIGHVVPSASKLVERDIISGDAAKTLDEVVDMFDQRFGKATSGGGGGGGPR